MRENQSMQNFLDMIRSRVDLPGKLRFRKISAPGVCRISDDEIQYDSRREALRAVSLYRAGARGEFRCPFKTLGVMYDCSRNGVPRIDCLKKQLFALALLGYNHFELYMEDTFQCPGEPFFGYGRGSYSLEELRDLDDLAASLGIELCAAIQCLGHMEQILKLKAYSAVADTPRILLADEEKTYDLIEKMIAFQSQAFRSRRINLGFDEAVGLGQGRHLEKFGAENPFAIFLRHLKKVLAICRKYGMKPMIWSDMFFRVHNPQHLYYVSSLDISPEDIAEIPKGVQLVFWDYYHWEESYYQDMIRIHRKLGFDPVMASMIWTPARLWYDHQQTARTVPPCIDSSRKAGLSELIFTLWGDDGAYCDFDSAMAGLTFAAAQVWKAPASSLQKQYAQCFGGNYDAVLLAAEMTVPQPEQFTCGLAASSVLWDDPLLGIVCRSARLHSPDMLENMKKRCSRIAEQLCGLRETGGGDLEYACALALLIETKITLRLRLEQHLLNEETAMLARKAAMLTENVSQGFRRQWLRRNKPFGLHLIQTRLAGQKARFEEIAMRIAENREFPELDLPDPGNVLSGETWHSFNLIPCQG